AGRLAPTQGGRERAEVHRPLFSLDMPAPVSISADVRGAAVLWMMLPLALTHAGQRQPSAMRDAPARQPDSVVTGHWGGAHVVLEATGSGATVEYDCAHGRITEALRLAAGGRFRARGTHTAEHGGPTRDGERTAHRTATYAGRVRDTHMELTVTLADPDDTLASL